jgi:hypothetical protein
VHPGPLYLDDMDMIVWDDRGPNWKDHKTLPRGARLMDLAQTEDARLTQEAREFFYTENLIVAGLDMDWFHYATPADVFDPSR